MADGFLRKWFGSPPAPEPALAQTRAELDRLATDQPGLLPLCHWLRDMLPELLPAADSDLNVSLDAMAARTKLQAGIPLLRDEPLPLDRKAFSQRWQQACKKLAEQTPDGAAAALAAAVDKGQLDPAAMAAAVVAGKPDDVRDRAQELGLDPGLATTLLRFTLFPLFTSLESSLGSLRAGVVIWERGYCPTCGSWPLLGEFRGLDQSRYLRCGLCAAGWEVPRLWCPFCDNRDHETLGFLHGEGEETKYRAALCDGCHGYVKMVSTLSALPPLHLLVADLATLHLDLAAGERGYTNHF